VIVAFIDSYKRWFGVEPICRVLTKHGMKITPSTYYAARSRRRSARAVSDEQLLVVIERVWENNFRCYGVVKCGMRCSRPWRQGGA
jgi:putative transposase